MSFLLTYAPPLPTCTRKRGLRDSLCCFWPSVLLLGVGEDCLCIRLHDEIVRTIWIDFDLAELTSANFILEEDIEVGICKSLWLRKTEVGPDQTDGVCALELGQHGAGCVEMGMTYGPEEACFALPVPRGRVHEMGLKSSDDDTTNVVDIPGDDHGLDSETSGRKLSNEGVAD